MKKGDFWQVTTRTTPFDEEVVVELMGRFFQQPVSVYTDEDTQVVDATVYVFARRDCSAGRIEKFRRELSKFVGSSAARVRVKTVRQQDWAESWKRHFKPLDIEGRLLVKPSWSKRRPKAGQIAITLDPGLSFGTGHHPTTSFCLGELVRTRKPGARQSVLDIGTGSGLLAIAAAKLGYAPVVAFDNDPEAVRVAKENLEVNGVETPVSLSQKGLEKLRKEPRSRFDVVCANLLAELLINERERIAGQLAPGGRLVVAGILKRQFKAVQEAFAELGFRLVRSRGEKEWRSGTFAKQVTIK